MSTGYRCWNCGADLASLPLPLGRLDECPSCTRQVHVCRMCVNYAPDLSKGCREDDAEEVRAKDRANFCDYFRPSDKAFNPAGLKEHNQAASKLNDLFGSASGSGEAPENTPTAGNPDDLFSK